MKLTLASLQKIAEETMKEFDNYGLKSIQEYDDSYIFSFAPTDDSPLIPGIAPIMVNKYSGKVEYLPIPPLENLEILNKAKVIKSF